jgi:hypothetical protein
MTARARSLVLTLLAGGALLALMLWVLRSQPSTRPLLAPLLLLVVVVVWGVSSLLASGIIGEKLAREESRVSPLGQVGMVIFASLVLLVFVVGVFFAAAWATGSLRLIKP